jgi:hypothetical protein
MGSRPRVKARLWEWRGKAGVRTPGIAIFQGQAVRGHLTPAQAISLANRLVDLAEQIQGQGETRQ